MGMLFSGFSEYVFFTSGWWKPFFFMVIFMLFFLFHLASLQTSCSEPHIGICENRVCRILALFSFKQRSDFAHMVYSGEETPQIDTIFNKRWSISCVNPGTCTHTAPLQRHPPLPCTYFPSPVVNCIPLDDITGNKRQQQDNKRFELQSTSFISDFITPQLMDVDLYTLLHLTCSIPQAPSSSVLSLLLSLTLYQSFCFFSVIYDPVTNMSPWINMSITVKESGWTLMQWCLGELNVYGVYMLTFMTSWSPAGQEAEWIKLNLLVKLFYVMGVRL